MDRPMSSAIVFSPAAAASGCNCWSSSISRACGRAFALLASAATLLSPCFHSAHGLSTNPPARESRPATAAIRETGLATPCTRWPGAASGRPRMAMRRLEAAVEAFPVNTRESI